VESNLAMVSSEARAPTRINRTPRISGMTANIKGGCLKAHHTTNEKATIKMPMNRKEARIILLLAGEKIFF